MAEQGPKADALVEEGLRLYSQGRLDEALARWRAALELAPDHHRGREYLKYVEDNRTALEESFAQARAGQASGAEPRGASPAEMDTRDIAVPSKQTATEFATLHTPSGGARGRVLQSEVSIKIIELPPAEVRPAHDDTTARRRIDEPAPAATVHERATPAPAAPAVLSGPPPEELPPSVDRSTVRGASIEHDPSFAALAAELAATAASIERELAQLPDHVPAFDDQEDFTPRIDLGELKEKVAAAKRKMTAELVASARAADPSEDLPGPPPLEQIAALTTAQSLLPPAEPLLAEPPPPVVQVFEVRSDEVDRPLAPVFAAGIGSPPVEEVTGPRLTIVGRGRRAEAPIPDFEPFEPTPVEAKLPQPSRVVGRREGLRPLPRDGAGPSPAELERDRITPARISPTPPKLDLPPLDRPAGEEHPHDERRSGTQIGVGVTPAPRQHKSDTLPLGLEDLAAEAPLAGARPRRDSPTEKVESMLASARQLHEQGTFEGSLWLCERVLAAQPGYDEAQRLLEQNRDVLLQQYRTQLGDRSQVPVVQIPQHEIVWHKLDHRAGFLLSRIDGQLSLEDLLDVSGMSEFEACRILAQLLGQGVIGPRR